MSAEHLTVRQAAALIRVTERTIRQWIRAGDLAPMQAARPVLVRAVDVHCAAAARRARRAQPGERGAAAYARHLAGATWDEIAAALGFRDESGAWRAARRWATAHQKRWPPGKR